jgi:hypothetical protein
VKKNWFKNHSFPSCIIYKKTSATLVEVELLPADVILLLAM